jgi:hypothetical protein
MKVDTSILVWLEDVTRILRSGQKITFTDTEMFDKILLEFERIYREKKTN